MPKLLLHVFGFKGEQANERVELQDAPTKEQEVGRSSQQALQRRKKPCTRTCNDHILFNLMYIKYVHLNSNNKVPLVFCYGRRRIVSTFSDVSQLEVVIVAEGIFCPD